MQVSATEESRRTLAELYTRHHGYVRRCLRRGGLPDDALDDAVHDVFVVLVRRLGEYRPESSMRQWLAGISRNVASALRRRWRSRAFEPAIDAGAPAPPLELHIDLGRGLSALDEASRRAVWLADAEGHSALEIAAVQAVPLTTAQWRIRSGRARLRALLDRMMAAFVAIDLRRWLRPPTLAVSSGLVVGALSMDAAPRDLASAPVAAIASPSSGETSARALASVPRVPPPIAAMPSADPEGLVHPGEPTIEPAIDPPPTPAKPRPRRRPRATPRDATVDFAMADHLVETTPPVRPPR